MSNKNLTPTPHNGAKLGEIAKRCIMPGDPKRVQWIVNTFLPDAKLVSDVRGILAYTGTYKKVPVTVMAHGMGIPSICIYTHELYSFYNVEVIYRIGSCGVGNAAKCNLGDVVLAKSGWAELETTRWTGIAEDKPHVFLPTKSCVKNIEQVAKEHSISYHSLPVMCTNYFYNDVNLKKLKALTGCSVVEMESYGLFMNAKKFNKKAACLLTVSDNIESGESMSAHDRATSFKSMVKLALESIIKEKI